MASSSRPLGPKASRASSPLLESVPRPVRTASQLSILLGIEHLYFNRSSSCHGQGKKSPNCGRTLSAATCARAIAIIKELADFTGRMILQQDALDELAGLILCYLHKAQADEKVAGWVLRLSPDTTTQKSGIREPRSPQGKSDLVQPHSSCQTTSSVRKGSSCSKKEENSATLARTISPRLENSSGSSTLPRRTVRRASAAQVEQSVSTKAVTPCNKPDVPSGPPSQRLRSTTRPNPPSNPTTTTIEPAFSPFKTRRTPHEGVKHLFEKIQSPILPSEKNDGFIYGYRRPGCGTCIKIGYTTQTTAGRMANIAQKCHYKPRVIFQIPTPNARKVEQLVHRHLFQERRREGLLNGLCDGGKGCPTRHDEWFEGVSDARARAVVQIWVDWIVAGRPYGEDGVLVPLWQERKKKVAVKVSFSDGAAAVDELWKRWTEAVVSKSEVKIEKRDGDEDYKVSGELGRAGKKDILVGKKDVKREVKKEVSEADVLVLLRSLEVPAAALNRPTKLGVPVSVRYGDRGGAGAGARSVPMCRSSARLRV